MTTGPLCVVLVAFDDRGRKRFEVLAAAASTLGLQVMRVAQHYSSGMILEEVVRSICDAHLIIADLTDTNRNVFYELGIAHALGKRVLLVTEHLDQLPFSFGGAASCELEQTSEGIERLQKTMQTFVNTPGTASPIAVFTGATAVAGQHLFWRRLGAFLLDALLLVALSAALAAVTNFHFDSTVILFSFLYFFPMSAVCRTTLAQRVVGLDVIQIDRQSPVLWQRWLRPLAALLSLPSLGATFLWARRFPRYQAVHDRLTRTLVVRRESGKGEGLTLV